MNSLPPSNPLWSNAWSQWQAVWGASGWHPVAMALAQVIVALLSLAAAPYADRPLHWRRTAWVLLALALSTLLSLELLVVELARAMAHHSGWYGERRSWQVLALVGLAALVLTRRAGRAGEDRGGLRAWPGSAAPAADRDAWLALGLGLVLALAVLRVVSWHASDEWLRVRVLGLSLGRLLEGVGLGLLALRATWLWQFDRR